MNFVWILFLAVTLCLVLCIFICEVAFAYPFLPFFRFAIFKWNGSMVYSVIVVKCTQNFHKCVRNGRKHLTTECIWKPVVAILTSTSHEILVNKTLKYACYFGDRHWELSTSNISIISFSWSFQLHLAFWQSWMGIYRVCSSIVGSIVWLTFETTTRQRYLVTPFIIANCQALFWHTFGNLFCHHLETKANANNCRSSI